MLLAVPKSRENNYSQTLENWSSIFNFSKSILKAWEAFSIPRKAFSRCGKHFQFLEKHSQSVRSILNFSRGILKARETFSTLRKSIRKTPEKEESFLIFKQNISIQACVILNFSKNHFYLGQREGVPEKRHSKYTLTAFWKRSSFRSASPWFSLQSLASATRKIET